MRKKNKKTTNSKIITHFVFAAVEANWMALKDEHRVALAQALFILFWQTDWEGSLEGAEVFLFSFFFAVWVLSTWPDQTPFTLPPVINQKLDRTQIQPVS